MYNLGDKVWFTERVYKDNPKLKMTDSNGIVWHRYEHSSIFDDVIFSGLVTGIEIRRTVGTFLEETSENDYINYEVTRDDDSLNKRFIIYLEEEAFSSDEAAQNYLQSK